MKVIFAELNEITKDIKNKKLEEKCYDEVGIVLIPAVMCKKNGKIVDIATGDLNSLIEVKCTK